MKRKEMEQDVMRQSVMVRNVMGQSVMKRNVMRQRIIERSLIGQATVEQNEKARGRNLLEGTLTVEAALVMAVTLFLIASLLRGAFEIHSQVAGNLVLQEALELADRREAGTPEISAIESEADRRLKLYFWCQNGSISLQDGKKRLEGRTGGSLDSQISIRKFNPEKFLRTVRAFGE